MIDLDFANGADSFPEMVWSGGANGTYVDELGVMRTQVGSGPRYHHDLRKPVNLICWSEDLLMTGGNPTRSIWQADNGGKILDAETVDLPLNGSRIIHFYVSLTQGSTYEVTFEACLVSGDPRLDVVVAGATVNGSSVVTLTNGWKKFTLTYTVAAGTGGMNFGYLQISNATGGLPITFKLRRVQLCHGPSDGRYRKTLRSPVYQRVGIPHEWTTTNFCKKSNLIGQGPEWVNAGVSSVIPQWSTGLDDAGSVTLTQQTAGGGVIIQDIPVSEGSNRWVFSVFFLPDFAGAGQVYIGMQTLGGTGQQINMAFNPSTAVVTSTSVAGAGASLEAHGIRYVGKGWYRAYLAVSIGGVGTSVLRLHIGHNEPGQCAWFGAQAEASGLSSLVPTGAATATRTQTTHDLSGTFAALCFPAGDAALQQNTFYFETQTDEVLCPAAVNIGGIRLWQSSLGMTTLPFSEFQHWHHPSFGTRALTSAGAFVSSGTPWGSGLLDSGSHLARSAFRLYAGNSKFAVNGSLSGNAITGSVPFYDRMTFGPQVGATSYVRRITIWRGGKSDADLQAMSISGPSAIEHDSGWQDVLTFIPDAALPANWGNDYDVPALLKTVPKAANKIWIDLFDPGKTGSSTPFEIGRLFSPEVEVQPAINASFPKQDGWANRTEVGYSSSGRQFFNQRDSLRVTTFSFKYLTPEEGSRIHGMQGRGIHQEVWVIPDPDDPAECQRLGFVGYLKTIDPIAYPFFPIREAAFQLEKKR